MIHVEIEFTPKTTRTTSEDERDLTPREVEQAVEEYVAYQLADDEHVIRVTARYVR